ncbi:MAG: helix-turn-helix transcriptional regulator [Clostridia bacterium]|nr:helix-turn-helix transcriptional regulator [Clostridia bacterium]MBR6582714.1 helix-turn-helix transcriptional regulator [Treponema sp.]
MFKKIFVDLCIKKNEAPTSVLKKLGLTNATYSKWTETSIPRETTLKKISDYFGVSIEYLKGEEKASEQQPNAIVLNNENIYIIPVYETVSAGFGAIPENNIIDYTPVYIHSKSEAENTICIKAKGDSMEPEIFDGDILQVYKTESINSDSIGIALVDGEDAYVKKIVYGYGWIELRSLNSKYQTMRFEKEETLRVRILGQVKKIIRNV